MRTFRYWWVWVLAAGTVALCDSHVRTAIMNLFGK